MEETVQLISNFISSVGFPIVACCLMFWQNSKLQETLSHNTETLAELKTLLGGLQDEN